MTTKIMCVGDSITKGAPANEGGYRTRLALLAPNLEFVGSQESHGAHEGYPGETIQQISGGALSAATTYAPELVLLMAGTNDIGDGLLAGAADRLLDLAEDFLAKPSVTRVIVGNIPRILLGGGNTAQMVADCVTFRDSLPATFAAASEGISLADVGGVVTETPDYYADYTHPNADGYNAMADAWYAEIVAAEVATSGTTYALIRDNQASLIEAITPETKSDIKLRREEGRADFKTWCQRTPSACLRRFAINGSLRWEGPLTSDTETETYRTDTIVTVAYPKLMGAYGADNRRDLFDVLHEDCVAIDSAIGHRGLANFIAGQTLSRRVGPVATDESGGVVFASMTFEVEYQRSV